MRRTIPSPSLALALVAAVVTAGCATTRPRAGTVIERGIASWYGPGFHGRHTASGERYDMKALTAAHPTLPFGTVVEVRNVTNGRIVRVRINDRGPFKKNRIIDLSQSAARAIEMLGPGTALVELAVIGRLPVGPPGYAVQVGAFQEPERAEELAASLCPHYPDVRVDSDEVWHRVQLGAFPNRDEAEQLAEELAARGLRALVVALPLASALPR
jgi:rare lipoprotein A